MNSAERDPANFSREEWQQARRADMDARALKELFRECWAVSDSAKAFRQVLAERGFHLARGDRRGFVAVDYRGEVYAIARWTGLKAREVKAKLGDPERLPGVEETKAAIAAKMSPAIEGYIREARAAFRMKAASLSARKKRMSEAHRAGRAALEEAHEARRSEETKLRAARLSLGFRGIWDRLSGKYARIRRQNEWEAWQAHVRDRDEKDALILRQLEERQELQQDIKAARREHAENMLLLHRDVAEYMAMEGRPPPASPRSLTSEYGPERRQERQDRQDRDGPDIER
jgi:hypothetical protein